MTDPKNGLKSGDVVRLKSGGPQMTIQDFGEGEMLDLDKGFARCQWFDGTMLKYGRFAPASLEPVSIDGGQVSRGPVAGGARPHENDPLI